MSDQLRHDGPGLQAQPVSRRPATAWTAPRTPPLPVDEAVRAILDQCYAAAVQIIRDSRQEMDAVVAYLLEKETITGAEMVAIIEGRDPAAADSPLRAEATATPAAPAEPVEEKPVEDKPAEEPPATDAPQDPPVTLEKPQEDEPPKEKP